MTDDLEIGEIGLPELVRVGCLVPELISGRQNHIGRAGDQVVGLEDAIPVRRVIRPLDGSLILLTL